MFSLFCLPECFRILFNIGLVRSFTVPIIVTFLSTVVASDVIQISPGSLLLLFSVALVIPSFPVLRKHDLVNDPVGLRIYIIFIIRLVF